MAVAAAGPAIFGSSDTCKVHRVPSLVGIRVRTVRQELAGPHRQAARCLQICGVRPSAWTGGVPLLVGTVGFRAESYLPPAGPADAPLAGFFRPTFSASALLWVGPSSLRALRPGGPGL